jgi:hypothetical protein
MDQPASFNSDESSDPYTSDPYEWSPIATDELDRQEHRMKPWQMRYLILLVFTVLLGNLGIASLRLGNSEGAFFTGVWIAQYVMLWLGIHSYVASKGARILLGGFLTGCLSVSVILGMIIAWRFVPVDVIIIILIGSLGIYGLAGWMLSQMLRRCDFDFVSYRKDRTGQYSIRTMLGLMTGSAILAMATKWLSWNPSAAGVAFEIVDWIVIGIWFGWLAFGLGLLGFLQLGAVRSRIRWFYRPLWGLAVLLGPSLFLVVGMLLLSQGKRFVFGLRQEYFQAAYLVAAGITFGIAVVIPLLPYHPQGNPTEGQVDH